MTRSNSPDSASLIRFSAQSRDKYLRCVRMAHFWTWTPSFQIASRELSKRMSWSLSWIKSVGWCPMIAIYALSIFSTNAWKDSLKDQKQRLLGVLKKACAQINLWISKKLRIKKKIKLLEMLNVVVIKKVGKTKKSRPLNNRKRQKRYLAWARFKQKYVHLAYLRSQTY